MSDPMTILLVDDELPLLEEILEFLTWNGVTVRTASDGVQALAIVTSDPSITVVLTDIRMPMMDGLTFANRLLKLRTDAEAVEVVLMTGHGSLESATGAVRAGAFDFLRKPMVLTDVLEVVRRAHAKALARRAAYAAPKAELAQIKAEFAALQARLAANAGPAELAGVSSPQLARILAHELRTPLIPVVALPGLLKDGDALPPEALNACLHDVQQAGLRLAEIADDLIELLAPPPASSLSWQPVTVKSALRRVQSHDAAGARAAGIALVAGPDTGGEVETDETVLATALARLISNAIAATPQGGEVHVAAAARGADHVAFTVRDTGRGMTEAETATARLPFHQLDMSLTRRTGGMGLGLSLAGRAAERLGGRLEIESALGQGTTAAIVLPRRRAAESGP